MRFLISFSKFEKKGEKIYEKVEKGGRKERQEGIINNSTIAVASRAARKFIFARLRINKIWAPGLLDTRFKAAFLQT